MSEFITIEHFKQEVSKTNSNIMILNEACGNLTATNNSFRRALRALKNDDVDKILGPTDFERERQDKRLKMIDDLWSRSGRGKTDPSELELKFYDLYTNLLAVEGAFKKKYSA